MLDNNTLWQQCSALGMNPFFAEELLTDEDGSLLPARKRQAKIRQEMKAFLAAHPIQSSQTTVYIVPSQTANVTRLRNLSAKELLAEYEGMVQWAVDGFTHQWQPWQRANEWRDLASIARFAVWQSIHQANFRGDAQIATYVRQAIFHALSNHARGNLFREALGITRNIETRDEGELPFAQTDLMDALRDTPNGGLVLVQAMGYQDKELGLTDIDRMRRRRAKAQLAARLSA